jgi:type VI secretion system FHA domain protein
MTLTLEVTGTNAGKVGERRKTFQESGGTIGRADGEPGTTHWRLPDGKVSKDHAAISYSNGTFFITDQSTNGVYVGASRNRLDFRTPYALNSGDTLFIEPYTLQVTIESGASAAYDDSRGDFDADSSKSDILDYFPAAPTPKPGSPPPSVQRLQDDMLRDPFTPPRSSPAPPPGPAIPKNWQDDPSSIGPVTPPPVVEQRPAKAESVPEPSGATGAEALRSVLVGAGLENVAVTPELARNFGEILRVVVEGVMKVLQARQEVKREFRLDQTMFRPADNNPLKFSTSVEDALHNLLVKRVAGYLGPVDAFDDAFDDIRNHQVAMLAGLRVAFDAMLQQFDPERLQEEFDRQKKAALVALPAKLRYWDQYTAKFHDMVRDSEACYSKLFGDEFARAYEEQLSRLKGQSRPPKR